MFTDGERQINRPRFLVPGAQHWNLKLPKRALVLMDLHETWHANGDCLL